MKKYFIWLAIYGVVWLLAFFGFMPSLTAARLTSICVFFVILFFIPLFNERNWVQTVLFCIQTLLAVAIFYPIHNAMHLYVLLILVLILAESVFYLDRSKSIVVLVVQLGTVAWIVKQLVFPSLQSVLAILLYILAVVAFLHYQSVQNRERELRLKNDALLDEYRRIKRQLMVEEEQARMDERARIGHEIHDSVGHKLTSLLMQLEVMRLSASEEEKEKLGHLKNIAQQSLEETRRAVKSFKQRDIGGLQGVIRLIRKLESESFMRVNFSVKHGAFAAPISGEQSFVIYRVVQEALTNIMKHSSNREAQVMFEAPGGSIFRFEITNGTDPNPYFQEGYGLKAMRERLEKVNGTLDIDFEGNQFIVRGSIRLIEPR